MSYETNSCFYFLDNWFFIGGILDVVWGFLLLLVVLFLILFIHYWVFLSLAVQVLAAGSLAHLNEVHVAEGERERRMQLPQSGAPRLSHAVFSTASALPNNYPAR